MLPFTFLKKHEQVILESSYFETDRHMMGILLVHAFIAVFVTSFYYDTYWLGITGSVAIMTLCTVAYLCLRGTLSFRLIAALAIMMFSALYIQQQFGRIEMHFHIFIGLAILTIYKDTLPVMIAAAAIIAHHFLFYWFQSNQIYLAQDPIMIFSYGYGVEYLYLHGAMVAIAAIVLVYIIQHSVQQFVKNIQKKEALEAENEKIVLEYGHLKSLIRTLPDVIWLKDTKGVYLACNPRFEQFFGASEKDIIGKTDYDFVDKEQADFFRKHDQTVIDTGKININEEWITFVSDGHRELLETTKAPMFSTQSKLFGVLGIGHDITQRKEAEEKLHLSASVFTHAHEGIMISDINGTIIDVNKAFTTITGYTREDVVGNNPRMLSSGRHPKEYYDAMWNDLSKKGYWYGEIWNRRKNGEVYAEMLTISAIHNAQGVTQQYLALFLDISIFKTYEEQLQRMAYYDSLTALPNRVLLADRLHQSMARVKRRAQLLAVLYLDLDGFKDINDTYGHDAGDKLLISFSDHMKQTLREGDTLARIGGDEFVLILTDFANVAESEPIISRLLSAAAQPIYLDDLVLQVSASLGVTFYPQSEETDADLLIRQADQAMYQAKLAGKNRFHVFDTEHDLSIRSQNENLENIRMAMKAREFVLFYQPKVNMRTGKVIGAEALIRWQHPQKGLLAPALFLPVIENHPLANALGEWVINTALTQMELWHTQGLDIPVSVNVGASQLSQEDFVQRLQEILSQHPDVTPACIELEVLETSALENITQAFKVIEECHKIGVEFALDDFGTGYSSLTYLKQLPVSLLKIDQSFVRDMLDDPDDLAILEGIIGLATAFRRKVIAEGVETVEHGEMLLQLGCDLAQGYAIAKPMPADQFPQWASTWKADPKWTSNPQTSGIDVSLLYASVEHRAWISATEAFLKDAREAPTEQDYHQCRFGSWMDSKGLECYGDHPSYQEIDRLHKQIHQFTAHLLELHAQNKKSEALSGLSELHSLRDNLLRHIKLLVQDFVPNLKK